MREIKVLFSYLIGSWDVSVVVPHSELLIAICVVKLTLVERTETNKSCFCLGVNPARTRSMFINSTPLLLPPPPMSLLPLVVRCCDGISCGCVLGCQLGKMARRKSLNVFIKESESRKITMSIQTLQPTRNKTNTAKNAMTIPHRLNAVFKSKPDVSTISELGTPLVDMREGRRRYQWKQRGVPRLWDECLSLPM